MLFLFLNNVFTVPLVLKLSVPCLVAWKIKLLNRHKRVYLKKKYYKLFFKGYNVRVLRGT